MNLSEKRAIEEFTKRLKTELGSKLLKMRLFGSKARGEFSKDSDIDILLILAVRRALTRSSIF